MEYTFTVKAGEYGAAGDGKTLDTEALQKAIDEAAKNQGRVVLEAGTYLTGSLFLHSNMEFHLEEGAVLFGSDKEEDYKTVWTRVAGIEMEWLSAVLNAEDCENLVISGKGMISGQGQFWWNKYWGPDQKGGMRKIYDAKDLRWVVDYDCRRPRNLVLMNCRQAELKDFGSCRSGFWNVHVCYSEDVHIDGLRIFDNAGPSTDGIDIDSCKNVLVEHCQVACNDDSICIKSGRDADGLRVNRRCENITIQDCEILTGCGVTIGSETSGGAKNIVIRNLKYKNTDCGFRIKSSSTRGGVIEDVLVENLEMVNVKYPFNMCLNWHPAYSLCQLPENYEGEIPDFWHTLLLPVEREQGIPKVKNMVIRNITSVNEPEYTGPSRAFEVDAFPEKPMENVVLENIRIEAKELGRIQGVKDWKWQNVTLDIEGPNDEKNNQYDVR